MSVSAPERQFTGGLAPAFGAVRVHAALVAALVAIAGGGWWWLSDQMRGMDSGPWTSLGAIGWFSGLWVVMMAAMMLPSVAPTIALYARMSRANSVLAPLAFVAGYLVTWAAAGMLAFAVAFAGRRIGGEFLAWNRAGRWVAGATLLAAAAYELTPLKEACLGKCRSPIGFLLGCWRDGCSGALQMGMRNGAWCVGCCWALMAALFALGIMSITWMALAGGLIGVEKLLPWRRLATFAVAAILLTLGILLLVHPASIPGLMIPSHSTVASMARMRP